MTESQRVPLSNYPSKAELHDYRGRSVRERACSGGRRYQVYTLADLALRTFPGVVVMTGRAHQEMNPRSEAIGLNTRFMSVWVEGDGE